MLQMISAISSPEDRELMEVFYEKHIDLLFFEAKKHLSNREDIEDAVYSTFQRLIEKMDLFRTLDASARARYAVVTVRNSCYMLLRKAQKQQLISFDEMQEEIPIHTNEQPDALLEQLVLAQDIRSVFSALEQEDRMLLEQKYTLRWTDSEMAILYGIKTASMRMKVSRARRRLLREMEAQGFTFQIPKE